jgi:LmbE family N-acetylglucosaminyl deacetylase
MNHAANIEGGSLLVYPERHPLRPVAVAQQLGKVGVVAPHPDDESLGCGGLLAVLADCRASAHVIIMTDGSRSHPNSATHPAIRLASIREAETLAALRSLGWPASAATFLRYGDCRLPTDETADFAAAVIRLRKLLEDHAFETVVVPWRRDPHCDHEATWRLMRAAVVGMERKPRWLEYPVWAWVHATTPAAPRINEAKAWRLDIASVLARKLKAVAQHCSQMGGVVQDDPKGFVLQPEVLQHFARQWELFLDPTDG